MRFSTLQLAISLLYALSALLAGATLAAAQAPAWQPPAVLGRPTTSASYSSNVLVGASAASPDGDVYVSGSFSGQLALGNTVLSSTTDNDYDVFITKWSAARQQFVWAVRAGGPQDEFAGQLIASNGDLFLGGTFTGPATFGPATLSAGNCFITKLTDTGTTAVFKWAQQMNVSSNGIFLAQSATGLYVATSFGGTAQVGGQVLGSKGRFNVLVAKLNDQGTSASFAWAQQAGGTSSSIVYGLAATTAGVYVAGSFDGPAAYGSHTITSVNAANDMFVARLTDAGAAATWAWAERLGGLGNDYATAVLATESTLYLTGIAIGDISFGASTFPANTSGSSNFVLKLRDSGTGLALTWVQPLVGTKLVKPNVLVARGAALYVGGGFNGTATFGSTALTSPDNLELFVAKLLDQGTSAAWVWAQQAGGPEDDYPSSLALGTDRLFVAGTLETPATFGTYSITNPGIFHYGYLTALADASLLATPAPAATAPAPTPYPNPAHGHVAVALPTPGGASPATLTLLDALGRVVRTQLAPVGATTAELTLAGVSPGVYTLRVAAADHLTTSRLAVE